MAVDFDWTTGSAPQYVDDVPTRGGDLPEALRQRRHALDPAAPPGKAPNWRVAADPILAAMSRRISSRVYVGRVPELERMRAVLAEVGDGSSRTVLVGGEAGVGKTRFLDVVVGIAQEVGFNSIHGRCLSSSTGLPFAGLRDALQALPEALDTAELLTLLAGVSESGPPSDHAIGPTDPTGTQAASRLFELTLGLIRRHAERRPLLVVIDDLHWAPPSTLELFSYLVGNPSPRPILVIGSHRTDIARRHALWSTMAELGREPTVERIALSRLSTDEVRDLATAIKSGSPAAADVDALARRSGGNPLFVEELLAAGPDVSGPMPDTVRDALRQRTLGISDVAQALLRAAAVAGPEVDEGLLAALTGLTDDDLWVPLRELDDASLLVPDRDGAVYGFGHALVREVVEDDLLPGERAKLHAGAALFLSEHPDAAPGGRPAAAGVVADHWEAARDAPRALPAHIEAGRAALRALAHAEAAHHLDRAVAIWDRIAPDDRPEDDRRASILVDAAEASALSGQQHRAVELIRAALEDLDDPLELAFVLDRLGQYLWDVGDDQGSIAARERALAMLPPEHVLDRARILSSLASVLVVSGRTEDARRVATEALEAVRSAGAEAEGETAIEGGVRNTLGVIAGGSGDIDGAVMQLTEARQIAERVDDPGELIRSYTNLAAVLGNGGRLAEALEVAEDGVSVARRVGLYRPYGQFLSSNALVALYELGRWDEASRMVEETLAEGSTGVVAAHLYLVAAQLAVGRGDEAGATRLLGLATEHAAGSADPSLSIELAITRAELDAWRGDVERSWRAIELAAERVSEGAPRDSLVTVAARVAADRAEQARGRRRAADVPAIRASLDRIAGGLPEVAGAEDQRPAARARATVDAEMTRLDGDADADLFSLAAELHELAGLPYPAAYLRFRQAEAILTHSRVRTSAAAVLADALATARNLGAQPLIREIDALARRARIAIPEAAPATSLAAKATDEGPGAALGLTERELEVLALVAAGRTNRQIAEELFISPKTAGAHVSNIIGKLGVSGRVEAATIAERAGLTHAGLPSQED